MRNLALALLYTATAALANPAQADTAAAEAARTGEMRKLGFHASPKPVGSNDFVTFDGAPLNLADWKGKWVLVNFWATWCAPCKKEMPTLSALQQSMGGESFEVLTIATGRNPPPAMQEFFEEEGIDNLPLHRDPGAALGRQMGVLALPVTVILNPEGEEVARLMGEADWGSESALAVLSALIGPEG
ncbi:TlpA family protein disulfide reductase [Salipiger sp. P9]|uniref:TlpA family protein disulfide reductase n=1 Tax=Salipiger pentaromativorans TaxID=2943193 RepID=UPI00215729ED|nr:TlpA disulfide reductase family protein [Salipiger pentaromativorans]MCR8548799.1 TlpA family protein disulfide reductase [Salipiger pentaromativorans]